MGMNELVRLAQQGNAEAFAQIYDQFAQKIFRFVRLKIQNQQEAEDVLQEVFLKAYRGLPALKLESLNFSAWLYKIAANTVNDAFRKKYRSPAISGMDENFDTASSYSLEAEASLASELNTVKAALKFLRPQYQQVLELRFVQDFSLEETAKIMRKSNLSVRLLQFRALKKLKLILNSKYAK